MQVVCVGLATRDTIFAVPELPEPDGRVVAHDVVVAGGGPAATAAVTIARLGLEAAFVGAVGDDDAGAFVRDGIEREGVDVSGLAVVPGALTAQSAILVCSDGSRSIVHHPGSAAFPSLDASALAGAAWVHADHVGYGHVQGLSPGMSVQDGAVPVSIDGGNPIDGLDLRGVALYAPTEQALGDAFGDARGALSAGAALVVVTRGAGGCVTTARDGDVFETPGFPVDAVSTLGAGDVFHGALLAFLARGEPLPTALRAANAAASLSCRALDARSAIPTLDELERRLS
jgi:sulfofructose kinase